MELLDALCCPVSQEPYGSAGSVRPRILPCGHTIAHNTLKSILKQESSQSHACPICRTYLPSSTAHTYPTNYAILDILPRILRLQHGADFIPLPAPTGTTVPLDTINSDSDGELPACSAAFSAASLPITPSPTPSTAAAAALFPTLQWLQARVELPLRLANVMHVAQGRGGTLRPHVAAQVADKYQVPPDSLRAEQDDGSAARSCALAGARSSWTRAGRLHGASESDPPVVIITSPCTLTSCAHELPPQLPPQPEVAVAAFAALQLVPDAWPCMQPLLGYSVTISTGHDQPVGAGSPPAAGSGAVAAALEAGGDEGVLEVVFARVGVSLREYVEQRPPGGPTLPPVEAAEILTQLIRMLVILHNHGLTTSATFPLRYSSLYVSPAAAGDRLGVRWAPWEAPDATGSFMWLADGMCVPPETAAAPSAAVAGEAAEDVDLQKADVWRAAAVVVTTLAAPWLSNGDRKASAWEMLAGLQGRLPSHLAIVLKGCLHEDPQQRWTAARAQLHLALVTSQARTSTGVLDSLWSKPVSWSIMLPCPPGRPSAAGRSSASNSRRVAFPPAEAEAPRGMDVVLNGAALQHARTFEYPDPLEEIANDMSAGERHYSCIMCGCLILCISPLVCLFIVMHMML